MRRCKPSPPPSRKARWPFLRRQYTTVAAVAVVLAIVIAALPAPLGWEAALGFVIGAVLSGRQASSA